MKHYVSAVYLKQIDVCGYNKVFWCVVDNGADIHLCEITEAEDEDQAVEIAMKKYYPEIDISDTAAWLSQATLLKARTDRFLAVREVVEAQEKLRLAHKKLSAATGMVVKLDTLHYD